MGVDCSCFSSDKAFGDAYETEKLSSSSAHFFIIMKKILLSLVALVLFSANVFADGLTATLQQGETMTPFYGVDAFKDAYAAASDGAVITLSAGSFNDLSGYLEKSVKIVGNFALDASSVERTILSSLTVAANNVTIDGVYFSGNLTLGSISDCKISHSWINSTLTYTSETDWHTNTVVDQCVVVSDKAIKQGKNYFIKNSTVRYFNAMNSSSNVANIVNCYIYSLYECRNKDNYYYIPYAIYKNNVLGLDIYNCSSQSVSLSSPSEFYYNYFFRYSSSSSSTLYYCYPSFSSGCINVGNITSENYKQYNTYVAPNKTATFGNGQDGTPIGTTGGTGFSLYPNIPRITSSTIDSSTDDEGKLNVSIKVEIPE